MDLVGSRLDAARCSPWPPRLARFSLLDREIDGPSECRDAEGTPVTLDKEDRVGAVSRDGSSTGFVGDLGLGLWKALGGDAVFFSVAEVVAFVPAVAVDAVVLVFFSRGPAFDAVAVGRAEFLDELAGATEALLVFFSRAFGGAVAWSVAEPAFIGAGFAGALSDLDAVGLLVDPRAAAGVFPVAVGLVVAPAAFAEDDDFVVDIAAGLLPRVVGELLTSALATPSGFDLASDRLCIFSPMPPTWFNAAPPVTASLLLGSPGRSLA